MKNGAASFRLTACLFGVAGVSGVLAAREAHAADFWVGPPGVANGSGTQASPFATIANAARAAQPGDTVHIHGGTYTGGFSASRSGTAGAPITFAAVDGELPILDGNDGAGTGFTANGQSYIRVIGVASRRWKSSGFDNGFNTSGSHVEFIDCIADNNGINGIAFYKATGVLIQNSIAHNGNQPPSWSSGVNVFTAGGTFQDNQIIGNVSFENVDICGANPCANGSTDGSGFILEQNSTGALFENNIAFHDGGSTFSSRRRPRSRSSARRSLGGAGTRTTLTSRASAASPGASSPRCARRPPGRTSARTNPAASSPTPGSSTAGATRRAAEPARAAGRAGARRGARAEAAPAALAGHRIRLQRVQRDLERRPGRRDRVGAYGELERRRRRERELRRRSGQLGRGTDGRRQRRRWDGRLRLARVVGLRLRRRGCRRAPRPLARGRAGRRPRGRRAPEVTPEKRR